MKLEKMAAGPLEMVVKSVQTVEWSSSTNYAAWLAQTYYHICHSTRVLAAAAARFTVADDIHHLQCIAHAKEEKNHEKIVKKDLQLLGFTPQDFPEFASTKALYQTIYYQIDYLSPYSIYGYVYFLEKLSLEGGPSLMEKAKQAFGEKSIQHLKLHTADDVEHLKAYQEFVSKLSEDKLGYVEDAIECTAYHYRNLILDSGTSVSAKKYKKIA